MNPDILLADLWEYQLLKMVKFVEIVLNHNRLSIISIKV